MREVDHQRSLTKDRPLLPESCNDWLDVTQENCRLIMQIVSLNYESTCNAMPGFKMGESRKMRCDADGMIQNRQFWGAQS